MEDIKQQLCTSVMKGDWKKAKEIYGEHREQEIQGVKITLLGDTALHMAVNTNIWENVDGLLHNQSNDVVLVDNKRNTPLHHAAKLGNERMCFEIARKQRHLLEERNANHETPLFMAAQHGQIKGFIILSVICCSLKDGYKKIYETGRRSRDGRTVLHCAIHGEYFVIPIEKREVMHDTEENMQSIESLILENSITITRTIRDLPAPGTDVENPPASSDPPRKESQRRRRNVRGLLLICLLKLIGLVCFG
ncbi:uncharacterized protein LOC114283033 isoform X2 [Camellia sinensis]|uniref:uncharacterized protein LOC114283033 isoform X2 n=1 Tax=Camellia sinensis TaxID=4442 RepID=UPI001035B017|nr:uncharacterized protein LOC114283033 isoform X2 [Camellia sinensis]